jgi:hypothetical protein
MWPSTRSGDQELPNRRARRSLHGGVSLLRTDRTNHALRHARTAGGHPEDAALTAGRQFGWAAGRQVG